MGHAVHFLSRLERLALPQVELALSLYRDPDLLRCVCNEGVPEGAERAAIALSSAPSGPHLVVTRDGQFVTCLAEGMSLGELPVVSRAKLDALAAQLCDLRERLAEAERLMGPRGNAHRLVRALFEKADRLSREEFKAISAFEPLMRGVFIRWLQDLVRLVHESRPGYKSLLDGVRPGNLTAERREALEEFWVNLWALGHVSAICSLHAREWLAPAAEKDDTATVLRVAYPAYHTNVGGVALRGFHLAARAGKTVLLAYKHGYRTETHPLDYVESSIALLAIGLRHAGLRAEVSKALNRPPCPEPHDYAKSLNELLVHSPGYLQKLLAGPQFALPMQLKMGRPAFRELSAHLPEGSPLRFARDEDVPEELALLAGANGIWHVTGPGGFLSLSYHVCQTARLEAEDLYWPKQHLDVLLDEERSLERAMKVIAQRFTGLPEVRPAKVGPKTGPNDPCPCGSGKKHKRCCAGKAREPTG